MYDKDFAELVKIAAEKLKEDTVYKMLTRSEDYQKESDERDKAERNYEQLDLTMEQRKVCDVFLDYRDRQSLEYSDYSYLTNSSSTLVSRLDICLKRIVLAFGEKHDRLWDEIYNVFEGKVPREKIDSFKAGAGTVLFLYDEATVKKMQEQFSTYADNFPVWANQANGMLQLAVWSMLRELNVGASLQHYNPVIDARVKEIFDIPENFKLVAQMPFGGIVSEPDKKEKEDIDKRVTVLR